MVSYSLNLTVTIGHETVMARATFFSGSPPPAVNNQFDFDGEYSFLEELIDNKTQVREIHICMCE